MEFKKVRDCVFENEKVRIYANESMLAKIQSDRTIGQIDNVSKLPGLEGKAMVMPDGHSGYGFPIGGVAAFRMDGGIISPGGVGYDINCGMRLLRTDLEASDVRAKAKELVNALFENIPSGVGSKGRLRLEERELGDAVEGGLDWAIEKGYAIKEDALHCEENGRMDGADYSKISARARKRGRPQLGTLGSGNHFIEIQEVEKIFDEEKARAFGLREGQACVMIHSGSRGFGHQICSDYIRVMLDASRKYNIELPDKELCCAPLGSDEANDYFGAMKCAVNYAFINRQCMAQWVRETFEKTFNSDWESLGMSAVYDVCHNIAKIEEHEGQKLCIHRKGATRAFWKGHPKVPTDYRAVGQPVIIPGSMQTASFVLCGLEGAKESWGSTCHGSGRVMSRSQAKREYRGSDVQKEMEANGLAVRATETSILAEEAGGAYKKVDEVVGAVERAGLCAIVARLKPIGVIKG